MSVGRYLVGVVVLAAMVGPVGVGAVRLRRRVLPSLEGAPGALAACVLAVATWVLVGQALGSVGLLRAAPVAVACVVAGAAMAALGRPGEPGGLRLPRPSLLAAVPVVVAVATWVPHVASAYRRGMLDGDTLWYHGPFAARFVQEGWVTRLHFPQVEAYVTFFPANSELLHALAALPFHRDVLSPVLNLLWLAMALLAGWCIGGRVPMAAVAAVACLPVLALTQAGTARNDIAGLALVLASVALLVHVEDRRAGVALAGLAAGLAVGTKMSVVPPAALLTVAVLVLRPRLPWLAGLFAGGSFWFLRNLVRTGSPLPWVGLGPLPSAPLPNEEFGSTAVTDRLGEPGFVGDVVVPGLQGALGTLWPVLLGLAVAGVVVGLRGDRLHRAIAIVASVGLVVYVATPNGAPGSTTILARANFLLNVRYALPALALALALLRGRWALAGLAVTAVTAQGPGSLRTGWEWAVDGADVAVGVFAAAAVVVLLLTRPPLRAVGVGLAALALVAGLPLERWSSDRRYRTVEAELPAGGLYPWAQDLDGADIALVGDFFQYPFYGPTLDNRVQVVGRPGPRGAFRPIRTCDAWAAAITGRDYVVIAPPVFLGPPAVERELEWTRATGAAEVVGAPGGAVVLRVDPDATRLTCTPG